MKCTFFYILAFCVVETVFSDAASDRRLYNTLFNMKHEAMKQINGITNPILQKIQSDVDKAKGNGKNAQPCYEQARLLMKSFVDPAFSNLETCRRNALEAESVQYAITCNNEVVSTFQENAYRVPPQAQNCLKNLNN